MHRTLHPSYTTHSTVLLVNTVQPFTCELDIDKCIRPIAALLATFTPRCLRSSALPRFILHSSSRTPSLPPTPIVKHAPNTNQMHRLQSDRLD